MSCNCKKPIQPPSLQQLRSIALATTPVIPVCPPGYHWDINTQKCVVDPPPPPPIASWNCTPNGCIDPQDGSGTYKTLNSCLAACPPPPPPLCYPSPVVLIEPPDGSVISLPTYIFLKVSNRNDALIYYTLDGSTPTDQSTQYSQPILITTLPTKVRAIARVPTCDYGAEIDATYTITSSLFFDFLCSRDDRAGGFLDASGGFVPNGSGDYNWRLKLTLDGTKTLKRLEIYETISGSGPWTTGQVWSTDNAILDSTLHTPVFPIVITDDGLDPNVDFSETRQLNNAYAVTLGQVAAKTYIWRLFGQPAKPLIGNFFRLKILFTDGTVIVKTIGVDCFTPSVVEYCVIYEMDEVAIGNPIAALLPHGDLTNNIEFDLIPEPTIFGSTTANQVAGKFDRAIQFTGVQGYLCHPDVAQCFGLDPNDNFSFGTWVNVQSRADEFSIFEVKPNIDDRAGGWRVRYSMDDGIFVFEYQKDAGGVDPSGVYIPSQPKIGANNFGGIFGVVPLNQWICIVCRYNVQDNTLKIRVNDLYEDTLNDGLNISSPNLTSSFDIRLGYTYFSGRWLSSQQKIDRTFYIKRYLSDAECTKFFNGSL